MIKLKTLFFSALAFGALAFSSCSNDDDAVVKTVPVTLSVNMPAELTDAQIESMSATFEEINSGTLTTFDNALESITVEEGTYNVSTEAIVKHMVEGVEVKKTVKALEMGVVIVSKSGEESFALAMDDSFVANQSEGLVFSEVFFTGNISANGKLLGDQYFTIYNNSEQVQYLDGLIIAKSAFLTTNKQTYTPDLMATHFSSDAMIAFPGAGTDYPLEPGKKVTVAASAANFNELDSEGLDMTKADFEIQWAAPMVDTDNPEVPNMISTYENFTIHDRGFESYVLFKLDGMTTEQFLQDNFYSAEYTFTFGEHSFPMDTEAYKIPNSMILDAVNLSVNDVFQWLVTSPSLDMSYAYCGTIDRDPARYGKAVVRRVIGKTAAGNDILADTNNSALDFESNAAPTYKAE